MKSLSIVAITLFAAGCAGSRPAVVFRSAAPSSAVTPPRVAPPPAPTVAPVVAAQPVADLPPAEAPPPAAAQPSQPGPLGKDCAHMLRHIGESAELFDVRRSSGEPDAELRAARSYFGELEQLDATHPNLHHALKLRVAVVSTWAARAAKMVVDPAAPDAERERVGSSLAGAIEAIGEYCSPKVVEGEAS